MVEVGKSYWNNPVGLKFLHMEGCKKKVSSGNSGSLKEPSAVMHTEGAAPAPVVGNPDVQAQLQAIWDKASESDRKAFVNKVHSQTP